jgi:hypothetical protein
MGGERKFESFVGNLGGFPPPGESEFSPLIILHTVILILIKRTVPKYPALIWYSIRQFTLTALKLKRV